jgi:hypothetical protein
MAATVMRGSCSCGANTFEVKAGVGMQRFYCHCLYCQEFMGKPYTDVTFVRARNMVIHGETRRSRTRSCCPPASPTGAARGSATPTKAATRSAPAWTAAGAMNCAQPFIETIGGSAGMVFIPSANF